MQMDHPFIQNLVSPQEFRLSSGKTIRVPSSHCVLERWRGKPIRDTYGNKPVLKFRGRPVFAEIAILRMLQRAGWNGVWVDTYRRRFRQNFSRHLHKLPPHAQELYDRICRLNGDKTAGCFDVFAWKGKNYLFVEAKRRGKDSIRKTQRKWISAALRAGVPLKSLLIYEWSL
jgi:hypothetical protein